MSIDGQSYLALYKENETEAYTVRANGQVFTPTNKATAYKVITHSTQAPYYDLGDIYLEVEKIRNVFFMTNSSSPFRIAKGTFLWMSYSDDEGQTWSSPQDITQPWMHFFGGWTAQATLIRPTIPIF